MLVHVDTEQAREELINSRLAYVSVSRGRYDAQIFTNGTESLGPELSRDVSKQSALETEHRMENRERGQSTENSTHQSVGQSHGHGGGYGTALWDYPFSPRPPTPSPWRAVCLRFSEALV